MLLAPILFNFRSQCQGQRIEIDDFQFDDIGLVGYDHHPSLKAEVAV